MNLPKYYIPKDLERAIEEIDITASFGISGIGNRFAPVLKKLKNINCLDIAECHYLQFLKLGLYLEEFQQRKVVKNKPEIRDSSIEKVEGTENKFKIYIKGLDDEDDLVLRVSDTLKAYKNNDPTDTVFFLRVTEVCKNHVIVSGNDRFCAKYSVLAKYNLVYIFNAYTFWCCHYALTVITSSMVSNYFFPKKLATVAQKLNSDRNWSNSDILNNPEQKQAVSNILSKSALPAPYIVYGPPGTGKTSTLVEAVCQIWKQQPYDYILICAPSNAACDVVTKRLLDYIPTDKLYRIYSRSHEYSKIDEDIRKCCNFKGNGKVDDIANIHFASKNIIITTLYTSLRLSNLKLPFSHLFIDEASQATLAEAFLPLCAVESSPNLQIVISGDHQQLGPGIRSKLAEPLLGQSILEKLMKHDIYKKDEIAGYDSQYVTKLIRNFRSSKDIIHVPNVLFYDSELIACTKTKLSTFPVSFHAVEGKELKASNSKSSYNEEEINEVLHLVNNFIHKKIENKTIGQKDIGIITPFSRQATQIRKRLYDIGLRDVDVGTVEIYQGQEKEVIIVTTVRSEIFIHNGVEHVGFLSNPKRFNVALTRAKSFLVVVGNPNALQINKCWRYFLRYCQENDALFNGDSFVIKDELHYLMQELSTGSKSQQSTDLFERSLNILTIDDGCSVNIRGKNHFSARGMGLKILLDD